MGDTGFRLGFSGHPEERRGFGDDLVFLKYALPHDDIHKAGFIFQGHKDHAFGGAGPLAIDDDARVADALSAGQGAGAQRFGCADVDVPFTHGMVEIHGAQDLNRVSRARTMIL